MAFRYRWAVEYISKENIKFRPHPTRMNIEKVNIHIFDLIDCTFRVFGGEKQNKDFLNSFPANKKKSLLVLEDLIKKIKKNE